MLDLKLYIHTYYLKLKAAEVEVKQCKKDVDAAKKQWGAKEAEEAALTMEIDELKKAIDEGNFVLKWVAWIRSHHLHLHSKLKLLARKFD